MTTRSTPPTPQRLLGDRQRHKLLRMARTYSEMFARRMMQAAATLDNGGDSSAADIEYVDSLNGIDVYEDTAVGDANATTECDATSRLRSFCHIEADIKDVARRLSTSVSSSSLVPGIVESHELCSVLALDASSSSSSKESAPVPERAGVNWFVLNQESTRDSVTFPTTKTHNVVESMGVPGSEVEFVVLSYQGVFKHRGRRGWLQWCQSVDVPGYPTSDTSKRGVLFSSGVVAVESTTRPGQVSVCYAMGVDLRQCANAAGNGRTRDQRKFLETAVWKRVMKLAALKKSMLRESLTRTLSIASTDAVEHDDEQEQLEEQGNEHGEQDTQTQRKDLATAEMVIDHAQKSSRNEWKTSPPATAAPETRKTVGSVQSRTLDRVARRLRAQTMEPPSFQHRHHESLFKQPSSLEFRLSLYNDPEDEPNCQEQRETATTTTNMVRTDWFEPPQAEARPGLGRSQTSHYKSNSLTGWL